MRKCKHIIDSRSITIEHLFRTKAEAVEHVEYYLEEILEHADKLFNNNNGQLAIIKIDRNGSIFLHTNRVNYYFPLKLD